MKKFLKLFLFIAIILLIIFAAFYYGGYVGFHQGWYYADVQNTFNEAGVNTELLYRLRDEQIDAAKKLMEARLNNSIANHWFQKNKRPSFLSFRFYDDKDLFDEAAVGLIIRACKYRKKYPLEKNQIAIEDENVKKVINYYLKNSENVGTLNINK